MAWADSSTRGQVSADHSPASRAIMTEPVIRQAKSSAITGSRTPRSRFTVSEALWGS